ncbi:MAG: IucA/IucC family protein, partial [Candidatus Dormibacteraceae bacterium]
MEDSHAAIRALLAARQGRRPHGDEYLESEQALIAGHRFHPMPKARAGEPSSWLAFAPEAHASFEMHHLAVREDLIDEAELGDGGELIRLDRMNSELPEGYRLLPTHPWQLELLGEHPRLQAALQK